MHGFAGPHPLCALLPWLHTAATATLVSHTCHRIRKNWIRFVFRWLGKRTKRRESGGGKGPGGDEARISRPSLFLVNQKIACYWFIDGCRLPFAVSPSTLNRACGVPVAELRARPAWHKPNQPEYIYPNDTRNSINYIRHLVLCALDVYEISALELDGSLLDSVRFGKRGSGHIPSSPKRDWLCASVSRVRVLCDCRHQHAVTALVEFQWLPVSRHCQRWNACHQLKPKRQFTHELDVYCIRHWDRWVAFVWRVEWANVRFVWVWVCTNHLYRFCLNCSYMASMQKSAHLQSTASLPWHSVFSDFIFFVFPDSPLHQRRAYSAAIIRRDSG